MPFHEGAQKVDLVCGCKFPLDLNSDARLIATIH